ncbi:MAG: hypothetical protein EHM28_00740 [Spirochaetaceae bacterium]|nr:MAG: hypothetical protein EHM28_00740 [Spirochaetaceae bacterium]
MKIKQIIPATDFICFWVHPDEVAEYVKSHTIETPVIAWAIVDEILEENEDYPDEQCADEIRPVVMQDKGRYVGPLSSLDNYFVYHKETPQTIIDEQKQSVIDFAISKGQWYAEKHPQ